MPRSTPLLAVPRGGDWLIAGSNYRRAEATGLGGEPRGEPRCAVTVNGRSSDVLALRLEGAERDQAWVDMVKVWPNYDRYAERTDREIKVFELSPR